MKQTVIEISDKDGVMPYSAETFRDAVRGTREYIRNLLAEFPADVTIGARSTAQAFEPLDWLLEEAVLTDQEKGGTA